MHWPAQLSSLPDHLIRGVAASLEVRRRPALQPDRNLFSTPQAAAGQASTTTAGPVPVRLVVPATKLAFGEGLKAIGNVSELGAWDAEAAPALMWSDGDDWTAELQIQPGLLSFKLVKVGVDGSEMWEEGADRMVGVPAPEEQQEAGAPGMCGVLEVACSFGDTVSTQTQLLPTQLTPEAMMQAQRAQEQEQAAGLRLRLEQLKQQADRLELLIQDRERQLAAIEADLEVLGKDPSAAARLAEVGVGTDSTMVEGERPREELLVGVQEVWQQQESAESGAEADSEMMSALEMADTVDHIGAEAVAEVISGQAQDAELPDAEQALQTLFQEKMKVSSDGTLVFTFTGDSKEQSVAESLLQKLGSHSSSAHSTG